MTFQRLNLNILMKKHEFETNGFAFKFVSFDIKLKRNFNTAHSSSSSRTNFAIRIRFNQFQGFGQCGLPPKKPGCYLADISDCFKFSHDLESSLNNQINKDPKLFTSINNHQNLYFQPFLKHEMRDNFCRILNSAQKMKSPEYRPAKSALQFAVFDLWSKIIGIKINQGIFPKQIFNEHKVYGFYTLSHQQNKDMIENGKKSSKITSFIKIKYNNDVKGLVQLLNSLDEQKVGQKWIIDFNCSLNHKEMQYLSSLLNKKLLNKILYIQQPFGLQIEDYQQWIKIKQNSLVKIIADQSFSNIQDISKVAKVAHGVNIKNEKTGGVFQSLKAAIECKNKGLDIIFGSMISTHLACNQAFQFYPLIQYFDIDGSLLIQQPSFSGGFQWSERGELRETVNIGLDGKFNIFEEI